MEKVKTKVRFTSLDVAAMVQNLQRLIGMRATNIYDLNPTTYIIKLAKSEEKSLLLIENGVRFHTVEDKLDKKAIPSGFTMKFRKFLRSKRLESIRQVGVERVVVFTFGTESFTNHLILELYSQGNIILTDNNYKILQCIRSHEFNEKVKTAVGEIYPFEYAANIYLENIDISEEKIDQAMTKLSSKPDQDFNQGNNKKKKKNNTKKQSPKLRDVVFRLIPCLFPAVIDSVLIKGQFDPNQEINKENLEIILKASKCAFAFLKEFLKSSHKGYLFSKEQKEGQNQDKGYFEYSAYEQITLAKFKLTQFPTFNESVAEYYSHFKKPQPGELEGQFEEIAWKKYDQIKRDQQGRLKKLQEEQEIYKVKAEYIEKNVEDVEAIIKIVKTMEDNGYSWEDIKRMIYESRKNGDPLANMIHDLDIGKRQVTILLGDTLDQEQLFELLPVQINIDYNAYTNATMYYESKKKNYQKEVRTKEASEQVLKIAEKDALKVIEKKKNEMLAKSVPTRKQFWFEKFYWFITSEGFLVISGRDSHQNETLVKKYMKPGDLYMHSDYGGAASTVIKNQQKDMVVPRTSLEEAAIFTICRSKAWDTKIMSGAWWVYHDQVSKSAPTGEFLPTGSFMIRGKRNFIHPNRMQMGITLLFKIDQESMKRHENDRRVHQDDKLEESIKEIQVQDKSQQSEEFSIVTLETNTKTKGPKGGKGNKDMIKKESKIQEVTKKAESENSESQSKQSDEQDEQFDKEKFKNKGGNNKNQKKSGKPQQEQQPKQKMRNKRKLKKLEKYMEEQDEEEREMIMKMIGAKEMKQFRKEEEIEEPISKNKKKDKNKKKGIQKYIGKLNKEQEEKLNPDKVLFLKEKKQESSSESEEKEMEVQDQPETTNQEEKEDEDNEEEQVEEVKEEQKKEEVKEEEEEVDEKAVDSELAQLNKLVGKLHPEDHYENLVAMCAPYNSINQNKFKIKLVPGGLKKGKAARNILHYFLNACELTEMEKPLVRSLPEQEVINALLGNVKLAGAGLLKMELKEKAEKKEKKKESEKRAKNN